MPVLASAGHNVSVSVAPYTHCTIEDGTFASSGRTCSALSLAGMPTWWEDGDSSVKLVRPLLGLRRETTRQACADWGLTAWDDPMNEDDRFARVRARRLLPVLDAALGPGIIEALSRTATLTRADADYLDVLVDLMGQPFEAELPVELVAGAAPALRGRLVRRWLESQGVITQSYERTQAVLSLVEVWRGQTGVDLIGGTRVIRRDNTLRLSR